MDFEFWMVRVFELQFGPFFCSRIWRLCCARPLTWPFQITQNYTCSDGILHDLTYTSERFRALLTPTKIPYLWNKIVAPVTIYVQHTDRHPSTHTHKYFVHLFDIGIQLLLQVCLSLSLFQIISAVCSVFQWGFKFQASMLNILRTFCCLGCVLFTSLITSQPCHQHLGDFSYYKQPWRWSLTTAWQMAHQGRYFVKQRI